MKVLKGSLIGLFVLVTLQLQAQQTKEAKMKTFIDALMKKMTLDEKSRLQNAPKVFSEEETERFLDGLPSRNLPATTLPEQGRTSDSPMR